MNTLCRLLRSAAQCLGRIIGCVGSTTENGPARVTAAVQVAADAACDALGRARGRHDDRFRADDQYRALLLSALGALLSTVMPPAVAATATAVIGYSGLIDRLWAPPQGRAEPPRRQPQYEAEERTYGNRLWDKFPYDD